MRAALVECPGGVGMHDGKKNVIAAAPRLMGAAQSTHPLACVFRFCFNRATSVGRALHVRCPLCFLAYHFGWGCWPVLVFGVAPLVASCSALLLGHTAAVAYRFHGRMRFGKCNPLTSFSTASLFLCFCCTQNSTLVSLALSAAGSTGARVLASVFSFPDSSCIILNAH